MPYPKTGPCPFKGDHWPEKWGDAKICPSKFASLDEGQRRDLIEYFYEHQSKTTTEHPKPRYRFYLNQLQDYTGINAAYLRNTVLKSAERKRDKRCVRVSHRGTDW